MKPTKSNLYLLGQARRLVDHACCSNTGKDLPLLLNHRDTRRLAVIAVSMQASASHVHAGARASCWTAAFIQDTLESTRCPTLTSLTSTKWTSCSSPTFIWTIVQRCHMLWETRPSRCVKRHHHQLAVAAAKLMRCRAVRASCNDYCTCRARSS